MNVADSERLANALDRLGCEPEPVMERADIIVLNSCVVRQGAEDKVTGRLGSLKKLKREQPDKLISLMGCMVGPDNTDLETRFPQVDCFMRPQEFGPLIQLVEAQEGTCMDTSVPLVPSTPSVATFIPIIHGCDKFCTFCIIPYRRGRERSRPIEELVREAEMLAVRGVKEVTLLGQNVDSYRLDLPGEPDLGDVLRVINEVGGIERIRFLTSHPNDMSERSIDAVAGLDKVCEFINLPVQAGDNGVLEAMRRGYTREQYLAKVDRIRAAMPESGLTTDIIVGFPGETEKAFEQTVDLVKRVRFDKIHIASYSVRPGTIASRKQPDDVPAEEKKRRNTTLEAIQNDISSEINGSYVGRTEEILVEGSKDGRWQGRTRSNKLVYLEGAGRFHGEIMDVVVEGATAFSLTGRAKEGSRVVLSQIG